MISACLHRRSRIENVPVRHLIVILGDQLDRNSAAFDGIDPALDLLWMCEAREEFTHIPSSRSRIAMFIAAMRHFRAALELEGFDVRYRPLAEGRASLAEALASDIAALEPAHVIIVEPSEWRLREDLRKACPSASQTRSS